MSSRRIPLSTNQNVANSPLRTAALKQKRTLAQIQREDQYGQPPTKKLVLDASTQRVIKSPTQQLRVTKSQIPLQARRPTTTTTSTTASNATTSYDSKLSRAKSVSRAQPNALAAPEYAEVDIREIQAWQEHHRARFPKSLFYFDQIPNDIAHRLKKQIAALGGRETAFFSVDVSHVVTSRPIPVGDTADHNDDRSRTLGKESTSREPEQETINPSLLTRNTDTTLRRLFDADLRARNHRVPPQPTDRTLRPPKKSVDILIRAKEMGKKIWTVEKLFRTTQLLLETDPYRCADLAYGRGKHVRAAQTESREEGDRNLLRLLQNERVNGPSDRDPTVLAQELVYFKGPYIYVYDIEEKRKPIMIKEYAKPADKSKGEWPQFQTASIGRCPFVEDSEVREQREAMEARAAEKARARAAAQEAHDKALEKKPILQPPRIGMTAPKPVTGKRTLGEMEQGHNRQSSVASAKFPTRPHAFDGENKDFPLKAFTGRSTTNRLVGCEPVASGLQQHKVTSAIRSQMVSSTAATPGVITGLSKEVHGLQRQVLQRHSTTSTRQQDQHPRRTGENTMEDGAVKRPTTHDRASSRMHGVIDGKARDDSTRKAETTSSRKKELDRELKPGYCENCAEKYLDFDEHIESKGHRKFAENDDNWVELDDLLAQLERIPKRQAWKPSLTWSQSSENDVFLDRSESVY
ncbi:hypothetical protein GGS20DRAFT_533653 [Poronia punctata]|nr:hypothetical protein GGS20DRAFT_533653 [Poronia punctata]